MRLLAVGRGLLDVRAHQLGLADLSRTGSWAATHADLLLSKATASASAWQSGAYLTAITFLYALPLIIHTVWDVTG